MIDVGPQPYSAACYVEGDGTATSPRVAKAVVSTLGDNSISLVDMSSGQITARIPNVPGSRALHGVVIDGNNNAWVAGTDANVVTVVSLGTGRIVASFAVRQPIAIRGGPTAVSVASGIDNTVTVFNPDTLQIVSVFGIAANPRDFDPRFAATSSGNSVVQTRATGLAVIADNIPGAFGLDGTTLLGFASQTPGLFVTSRDSDAIYMIKNAIPAPHAFDISNGASFGTAQAAPGQLASLFATTGVNQNVWASSIPLPRTLGGVTIKIGGSISFNATTGQWDYSSTGSIDAPLMFVGPNQVNFQIPPGIELGDSVPVQMTRPDNSTLLSTVHITATAPGLFSVLQNGQGQAAVLNQDNTLNFGTNPAARESVIQIFATGGGETTPPLLPGEAASSTGDPLIFTNVQPTVTIGGINAKVEFSGMAPGWVGLWQINAEVPANVTPGSARPLVVTSGGVSSNTVTIAVQ